MTEHTVERYPEWVFFYWLMVWSTEYENQLRRSLLLDSVLEAMRELPGAAGCAGSC